jgi:class 3 adenylate cyclase
MSELPAGTVTFVFTDIEGSTRLLQELGDEGYGRVSGDHRRLVREAFGARGGAEIDTQGDAFFFSFPRARDAVAAAVAAQRALQGHAWPDGAPVRVRMGLHTGEPSVGEEGYLGLDVVRAARICSAGHGGQILLSETTRALLGNELPDGVNIRDLGRQDLKDIQDERIFELSLRGQSESFPALRPERHVGKARADALGDEFSARITEYVNRTLESSLGGGAKPLPQLPSEITKLTRLGLWIVATIVVGIVLIVVVVKLAFF